MAPNKKHHYEEGGRNAANSPEPVKRTKPNSHAKHDSAVAIQQNLRSINEADEESGSQEVRDSQTRQLVDEKLNASKVNATFLTDFKCQVKDDRVELRALLTAKIDESIEYNNRKKKLRDIVSTQVPELDPATIELKEYIEVYGDKTLSPEQLKQLEHVKGMAGFYPLSIAAGCILASSSKLLSYYEGLNNEDREQHVQGLVNMREAWKEDKEAVAALLEKGKKVSQARIQRLIPQGEQATNKSSAAGRKSRGADDEASHFFPQRRPDDDRLHQAFQQGARGVSRIVRELPKHE